MFTLGIIDKLEPADLTGGKIIAGTGTMDDDGNVGADRRHPAEDGRARTRPAPATSWPRPTTAPRRLAARSLA